MTNINTSINNSSNTTGDSTTGGENYLKTDTFNKKPITTDTDDTIKISTKIEPYGNNSDDDDDDDDDKIIDNSDIIDKKKNASKKKVENNDSNNDNGNGNPHRTQSFLNNDGIDNLVPRARRARVSSLSLTDQVFNNLHQSQSQSQSQSQLSLGNTGNGLVSESRRSSVISNGSLNSNVSSSYQNSSSILNSPKFATSTTTINTSFDNDTSGLNGFKLNSNSKSNVKGSQKYVNENGDYQDDDDVSPDFLGSSNNSPSNNDFEKINETILENEDQVLSLPDTNHNHHNLHRNHSNGSSLLNVSRSSSLLHHSRTNTGSKKTIIDHERVASYAFAFDIDGVLIRGKETIPEAVEAMKLLNGENKYNIKVPYIFITNGGGNDEKLRCENLTKRLKTNIQVDQIIQGHTPMKSLTGEFKNVLVVGGIGDSCRKIAENYGFENVYIPLDIIYWNPNVSPYYKLSEEEIDIVKKDVDFSNIEIDAILVFADSRNWNVDQQIILELLLSKNGKMGTLDQPNFNRAPELFFAHSDFVWATDYNLNRYGMGALQISIAALYQEHTGGKVLKVNRFGKPQRGTFRFAEKVLTNWRKNTLESQFEQMNLSSLTSPASLTSMPKSPSTTSNEILSPTVDTSLKNGPRVFPPKISVSHAEDEDEDALETDSEEETTECDENDDDNAGEIFLQNYGNELILPPASTVYFVGDTPESDIRFANSHDESWFSILVKTGVYQDGSIPKYKPKKIVENVLEAVKFAIEREHENELKEWNAQFANADD